MHEYSLAHGLLEALVSHLRNHPVDGEIRVVHVRKGEMMILSEEALKEAWRVLSEGTPLAGTRLELEHVTTLIRCRSCGYEGAPGRLSTDEGWHAQVPVLSCPVCGERVEVVQGKELAAVSLTVDSPPTSGGPSEGQEPEGDRPAA